MKMLISIAFPKDVVLVDIGRMQGCEIVNQREPATRAVWKQPVSSVVIPTKMKFDIRGLASELPEFDELIKEENWKSPKEQTLIIELRYDTSGSNFSS